MPRGSAHALSVAGTPASILRMFMFSITGVPFARGLYFVFDHCSSRVGRSSLIAHLWQVSTIGSNSSKHPPRAASEVERASPMGVGRTFSPPAHVLIDLPAEREGYLNCAHSELCNLTGLSCF
ncbi:hypothetical protein K474DRAFT_1659348 [Panus rudis PR-1116 ss-1]|nr:hypothetical protein K474DRAFT_1659348 [Panus rudis PR-1116 ss-1]